MKWFKKQTPPEDPLEELKSFMRVYAYGVEHETYEYHTRFDVNEETILARDAVHEYFLQISEADREIYRPIIRQIDTKWHTKIRQTKTADFAVVDLVRDYIPKSEWWFWIDQLEMLSPEDTKTI